MFITEKSEQKIWFFCTTLIYRKFGLLFIKFQYILSFIDYTREFSFLFDHGTFRRKYVTRTPTPSRVRYRTRRSSFHVSPFQEAEVLTGWGVSVSMYENLWGDLTPITDHIGREERSQAITLWDRLTLGQDLEVDSSVSISSKDYVWHLRETRFFVFTPSLPQFVLIECQQIFLFSIGLFYIR